MKSATLQFQPTSRGIGPAPDAEPKTLPPQTTNARWPQLIDCKQLIALTRMSRSKLYLLMNPSSKYFDKSFPRPATIGARSSRWSLAQVEAWLASKFDQCDGGAK